MAGPATEAVCHAELRQAAALAYADRGTISASSAMRAGLKNARAMPLTKMTTKKGQAHGSARMRGCALNATKQIEQASIAVSDTSVIVRRLRRSAVWPAGSEMLRKGRASARPTRPSERGSWVMA